MIPAALIALLAIVRLGAIHAVVFGGFSAPSLAQRIEASRPRMVLTASCGIEGGKGPIPYKPMVEGAVEKSSWKPEKVIVWQREESKWDGLSDGRVNGLRDWRRLVRSAKQRGVKAECVPVRSEDPSYIIYTSGTTGERVTTWKKEIELMRCRITKRSSAGHSRPSVRDTFSIHSPNHSPNHITAWASTSQSATSSLSVGPMMLCSV